MRKLIALLLVFSLSWVTTGYACQMDRLNRVRALCCCKHVQGHQQAKVQTASLAMAGAAKKVRCCDELASAALDDQNPGVVAKCPALDLPVFAVFAATTAALSEPTRRRSAALPMVCGPPAASGSRTYLTTARLRL